MAQPPRDSGYTLVEVLMVIVLMGLMMAISVAGYGAWAKASEQSGTARDLQSLLRQTQQRAVTDGNAMCVLFDVAAGSWTVYRDTCSVVATQDPALRDRAFGPDEPDSSAVHVSEPLFNGGPGVTFYARGTATQGQVKVTRDDSTKTYVLHVEGLTGRVSLS